MNSRVRRKVKSQLWEEQKGLCWLCGGVMIRGRKGWDKATFDHIKPRSKFGTDHYSNLKLAHYRCNNLRGNQDV